MHIKHGSYFRNGNDFCGILCIQQSKCSPFDIYFVPGYLLRPALVACVCMREYVINVILFLCENTPCIKPFSFGYPLIHKEPNFGGKRGNVPIVSIISTRGAEH